MAQGPPARQRALPATPDLPPARRRLDKVCAPGYLGRKRGEIVRTRTTVLQAHTHQWVGLCGIKTDMSRVIELAHPFPLGFLLSAVFPIQPYAF